MIFNFSLIVGWLLDHWLGDPAYLPHPVVAFGKAIACLERRFNRGSHRKLKGALTTLLLVSTVYLLTNALLFASIAVQPGVGLCLEVALIFFGLAGTTLIREVRRVFWSLDDSLEAGRKQVARIVGRDTSALTAQEVRTAALETLAENLSDGVIAPLFWCFVLGVPGMMAYKMINTLDSMIGYRNERYSDYGYFAAKLDDVANFIPARITAFLMVVAAGKWSLLGFVGKYGNQHASPNSGYPEAALAGILNCRFGGPHNYFGKEVWKPYIGYNERLLTTIDMERAVRINQRAELLMVISILFICFLRETLPMMR